MIKFYKKIFLLLFLAISLSLPIAANATAFVTCGDGNNGTGNLLWCISAQQKCASTPYDAALNNPDQNCQKIDQRLGSFSGLGCLATKNAAPQPECSGSASVNVGGGIGCCVLSSAVGKKCIDISTSIQKDACAANSFLSGVATTAWTTIFPALSLTGDIANVQFMEPAQCAQEPTCPTYNASAAAAPIPEFKFEPIKPKLQIDIPTVKFSDIKLEGEKGSRYIDIPFLAEYIRGVYQYAIGFLAMLAVIMLMIGGVKYIMARGGAGVGEAKKMIGNAIFGLILGFGSYIILNSISPSLTNLTTLRTLFIERETAEVEYPPPPPESSSSENDGSAPPPGGKVPFFGQYAAPWGEMKPDGSGGWDNPKCQSIRARGCGTTSLAMVLKFYGKNVTPKDTGSWGLKCGIPKGAWLPPSSLADSPWPDLKMERIGAEKAMELAAQGKPIIFNCAPCVGFRRNGNIKKYGGHYMVLTGSDDGGQTFTVNDPGANLNAGIVKMTREQVVNPLVTDWQKACGSDSSCMNKYGGSRVTDGRIQKAFKFGLYVHP